MANPKWLEWAQNLQALAQSGLTYSPNPFDIERYEAIREIAAEMLSTYSETDLQIIRELYESQSGYTTPKVDARGVVFKGDQVLLVRELADGGFTLPGGWVDVNEPPSAAVEREVREETGYLVKAKKLLAVYDRKQARPSAIYFPHLQIGLFCANWSAGRRVVVSKPGKPISSLKITFHPYRLRVLPPRKFPVFLSITAALIYPPISIRYLAYW